MRQGLRGKILMEETLEDSHYRRVHDVYVKNLPMQWKVWFDEWGKEEGYKSSNAMRNQFQREREIRGDPVRSSVGVQKQIYSCNSPIVGVIDVETMPLKIRGLLWGVRDQYIDPKMVEKNSCLLSWAGKYLHDSEMHSDIMTSQEAKDYDSKRVAESMREFVSTCDIVIGHNWSFDSGILVTELTRYSLPPVKYRVIDTYLLIKKHYTLPSYKLSYVNKVFGIRDKISNEGMPLWEKCVNGDPEGLSEMMFYNEGDILATESLFWTIQPYVDGSLPNFGTYQDGLSQSCHCGSTNFKQDDRYWYTNLSKFERFVCEKCGAVHRGRKNLLSKDKRSSLLVRL